MSLKGLKKALKNFSQMFEDEKEPEIQIGFPTDVKHVAHIGWDGPAAVESPSWMKEFNGSGGFQSAPLGSTGAPVENPQVKWVSEDSKSRKRDLPELPKSSRRHSSTENSLSAESPSRETSSSKTRHSRKHQSKDSTESLKGSLESEPRPDIPKKSRRKKSKESIGNVGGSSSRSSSRSKGNPSSKSNDGLSQTNNMDSLVQEEEKETSGVS